jgi:predicted acyl esterase
MRNKRPAIFFALSLILGVSVAAQQPVAAPTHKFEEVMIPMRDGVRLQTVIPTPADQKGPLPILFHRRRYGVTDRAFEQMQMPPEIQELAQDGYIFVVQNLRGRSKSEGVLQLSFWVDLNDPKATDETTGAYDSIEWLVKNVSPGNSSQLIHAPESRMDGVNIL